MRYEDYLYVLKKINNKFKCCYVHVFSMAFNVRHG